MTTLKKLSLKQQKGLSLKTLKKNRKTIQSVSSAYQVTPRSLTSLTNPFEEYKHLILPAEMRLLTFKISTSLKKRSFGFIPQVLKLLVWKLCYCHMPNTQLLKRSVRWKSISYCFYMCQSSADYTDEKKAWAFSGIQLHSYIRGWFQGKPFTHSTRQQNKWSEETPPRFTIPYSCYGSLDRTTIGTRSWLYEIHSDGNSSKNFCNNTL